MRLSPEKALFISSRIKAIAPEAQLFLFGSRVNDCDKGGDIDICIVSDEKIRSDFISQFRIAFFKAFGFQKLDLVNFTADDNCVFKQIILSDAVKFG